MAALYDTTIKGFRRKINDYARLNIFPTPYPDNPQHRAVLYALLFSRECALSSISS